MVHESAVGGQEEPGEVHVRGTERCHGEVDTIATTHNKQQNRQHKGAVVVCPDAAVDPGNSKKSARVQCAVVVCKWW